MPGLDPQVLAGLIGGLSGLGGSAVGAFGTFLATRATLKSERDKAREQRLAEQEEQAITAAMTTIGAVIDASDDWGSGGVGAQSAREDELSRQLRAADRSLILVRNRTVGKKVSEALYVIRMWDVEESDRITRQRIRTTAQYALDTLAAYARGEDWAPEPSSPARQAFESRLAQLRDRDRPERAAELQAALEHRDFRSPIPVQAPTVPVPPAVTSGQP